MFFSIEKSPNNFNFSCSLLIIKKSKSILLRSSEAIRFNLASPINWLFDFKLDTIKLDSPSNFSFNWFKNNLPLILPSKTIELFLLTKLLSSTSLNIMSYLDWFLKFDIFKSIIWLSLENERLLI